MRRDFFIIEKRGNYYSFPNDQNLPKTGKELAYWSISKSQFYRAFICIDIAVIHLYIFGLVHQDWRLALQSYFLHQRLVENCKDSFSLLYLYLWFCWSCWSHNLVRKIIFALSCLILFSLLVLSLIPTINYAAAMSWLSSPYPQNALKFWGSVRTCFVILVFVICPSFSVS